MERRMDGRIVRAGSATVERMVTCAQVVVLVPLVANREHWRQDQETEETVCVNKDDRSGEKNGAGSVSERRRGSRVNKEQEKRGERWRIFDRFPGGERRRYRA